MISKAKSVSLTIPGIVGIVVPVVLSLFDPWSFEGFKIGLIVFGLGLIVLLICLIDFTSKAKETLAPFEPPKKLVKKGPYRYVRNPIYFGVLLMTGGIGIISASVLTVFYLVILFAALHLRIILFEEPSLAKRFPDWREYATNVPRWIPRLKPWKD